MPRFCSARKTARWCCRHCAPGVWSSSCTRLRSGAALSPRRRRSFAGVWAAAGGGPVTELAVRLERKKTSREDLAALLERSRAAFSAALLLLYGQQPDPIDREIAPFLAKNLTKTQIMRTIELLQKYHGECVYNVGPSHVLGALAVELEGIL